MSGVQRFVVAEDSLAPRSVVGDKEFAGCVDVVLATDHARIVAEATAEARAAERRHWEARFRNAEQAHAAALAKQKVQCIEHQVNAVAAEREKHAAALAEEYRRWRKAAEDVLASWPRTLTADDPEPGVGSVVLDRDQSVWQRVGSTEHSRWVNPFMGTREWPDVLARGPVRLIHDGEAGR